MSQITAFDKVSLPVLRNEIDAALAAIGEKYGISLVAGNARYAVDGSTATFKLDMAIGSGKDRTDVRYEKYAQAFERYKFMVGDLNLNDTYVIRGGEYKIVGYNAKAREYPLILVEQKTQKAYKFDIATVKSARVKK